MTIKELFGDATLSYAEFEKLVSEKGAKFVDLSEGKYVSKDKFDNEVAGKDNQITQLNDTIKQRDKDLKALNTQLKEAGADAEKLAEFQTQIESLQSQYKQDTDNYKAQLSKQAYEFAVKEFANQQKFSSKSARKSFIDSMIAKELKMDGDKILGADDFLSAYAQDDADAFIVEKQEETPQPPKPTFSQSVNTQNNNPQNNDNPFGFHFSGVRANPNIK